MDRDLKLLLGKVLGEVYRVQKRLQNGNCPASDAEIFGLVNGFDFVVDEHLESFGTVTRNHLDTYTSILNEFWSDPEKKLKTLKGFYDIEGRLQTAGVDRMTAIMLTKYLRLTGQFAEALDRLDTSDSPGEMRNPQARKTET